MPDGIHLTRKGGKFDNIWDPEKDSKRSMHITDEQNKRFSDANSEFIKSDNWEWAPWAPCSHYAAKMWEAATGEHLEDRHLYGLGYSDPNVLADSIDAANENNPCP